MFSGYYIYKIMVIIAALWYMHVGWPLSKMHVQLLVYLQDRGGSWLGSFLSGCLMQLQYITTVSSACLLPGQGIWYIHKLYYYFIGGSLSRPHTSMTSLHTCVCMFACLDWPLTENFKWARLKFNIMKIELMHSVGNCERLLPSAALVT